MNQRFRTASLGAAIALGAVVAQSVVDGPDWPQALVALAMGTLGWTWGRRAARDPVSPLSPIQRLLARAIALVGAVAGLAILAAWLFLPA
jgi:hypothetical protein